MGSDVFLLQEQKKNAASFSYIYSVEKYLHYRLKMRWNITHHNNAAAR